MRELFRTPTNLTSTHSGSKRHLNATELYTLLGCVIIMYLLQHWVIDWDKVKTQEDLITILKELNLGFERPSEELKKLCKFVNKSDGQEVTFD